MFFLIHHHGRVAPPRSSYSHFIDVSLYLSDVPRTWWMVLRNVGFWFFELYWSLKAFLLVLKVCMLRAFWKQGRNYSWEETNELINLSYLNIHGFNFPHDLGGNCSKHVSICAGVNLLPATAFSSPGLQAGWASWETLYEVWKGKQE